MKEEEGRVEEEEEEETVNCSDSISLKFDFFLYVQSAKPSSLLIIRPRSDSFRASCRICVTR